jgi:hypothetical protein
MLSMQSFLKYQHVNIYTCGIHTYTNECTSRKHSARTHGPTQIDQTTKQTNTRHPTHKQWSDYPKELVEDKQSRQAQVKSALNTKVFDPLDNADIGMVSGDHDRSRSQYRVDMREATGCDMGERDCFEDFKAKNAPPKAPKEEVKADGAEGSEKKTGTDGVKNSDKPGNSQ